MAILINLFNHMVLNILILIKVIKDFMVVSNKWVASMAVVEVNIGITLTNLDVNYVANLATLFFSASIDSISHFRDLLDFRVPLYTFNTHQL
ncbi:hypothetical protein TorRG33x02_116990 [Trema orientale]|uniref:Uncharacterized protein n=1 Tax=Trema orientale TaxID=63057 RepID=A0A2P5F489_TREOI|nr:hypothetical protein TorRG33x02_116990 [Trema orientale]